MLGSRARAIFWALLTFGLHSIPRAQLRRLPGGRGLTESSGPDKVAHLALFAVLGWLWGVGFRWGSARLVVLGILYGGALEIYQGALIAGRSASLLDLGADAAGVFTGVVLAARLASRRATGSVGSPPAPSIISGREEST